VYASTASIVACCIFSSWLAANFMSDCLSKYFQGKMMNVESQIVVFYYLNYYIFRYKSDNFSFVYNCVLLCSKYAGTILFN
jgi:hypothetical protein